MSTERHSTTLQILELLRRLESSRERAMPINRVAEEFEVNRRTVIRWVEALEAGYLDEDGRPLVVRERRGSGEAWVCLPRRDPVLTANIFQYAAVRAAALGLQAGQGSLLGDCAEDAACRIIDGLGGPAAPLIARVPTAFYYRAFAPKDLRAVEDTLDVLLGALLRCRAVTFDYTRPGKEPIPHQVNPYTLVTYRDGLYLIGLRTSPGTERMRIYALERISGLEVVRGTRFSLPEDYDPADLFGDRFGVFIGSRFDEAVTVELAFDPRVQTVARARCIPGTRGWSPHRDGWEKLTLEIPLSPELTSWILSWGEQVEVLAPASLRQEVARVLSNAASRYQT